MIISSSELVCVFGVAHASASTEIFLSDWHKHGGCVRRWVLRGGNFAVGRAAEGQSNKSAISLSLQTRSALGMAAQCC